jgi:LmbE family N-acetylglucosaminyl deacetylase
MSQRWCVVLICLALVIPEEAINTSDLCAINPITCNDQNPNKNLPLFFSNVLVVAAHPDDIENCAGGTIAKWIQQGATVRYVLLTNGDKGTGNTSMTPQELAKIRRQEQLDAAQVLGVTSVDFFDVGDGELENVKEVRRNLTRLIRTYRPHVILTWNPNERIEDYLHGVQHTDHRAAGAITLQCVYPTAADFLFFPEQWKSGLRPWGVPQIWLFSWHYDINNPYANVAIDITSTLNLKIKACLQHKSQVADPEAAKQSITRIGSLLGNPVGYDYAEWFTRIIMPYPLPETYQTNNLIN